MTESNRTISAGVNRPIQIIPSVLPADWANMGACVKELEEAGVDSCLLYTSPSPRD